MEQLIYSSVEILPNARASVAFTEPMPVFKEDGEITPTILSDAHAYMPWGATNQMPFDIIDLMESDETLATCQMFNAEVCYGSGLVYDTARASASVASAVEDFTLDNDLPAYFLGVCQDFKHFAFAVSVVILNAEGTKIVRVIRNADSLRLTATDAYRAYTSPTGESSPLSKTARLSKCSMQPRLSQTSAKG